MALKSGRSLRENTRRLLFRCQPINHIISAVNSEHSLWMQNALKQRKSETCSCVHWQQTNQPDEEGARDTGLSKHSKGLQRLFRVTLCLHRCHDLGFTMSRIIMSVTKDNLFTKIAVVIFIVIVKCVFLLVSLLINVIRCCKVTSGLSYQYRVRSLLTRSFLELTWTA